MKTIASIAIIFLVLMATTDAAPKRKTHAIKGQHHRSPDSLDASEGWWDDLWENGDNNNGPPPKTKKHWWDDIWGKNDAPAPQRKEPHWWDPIFPERDSRHRDTPRAKQPEQPKRPIDVKPTKGCGPATTMGHEGLCSKCYLDQLGIPSIGVGLNLEVSTNRQLLEKYGAVFDDIETQRKICRHGANHCTREDCSPGERNCLPASTLKEIFEKVTWPQMLIHADRFVPNLPPQVRAGVADLAMMGTGSLSKFKKLKKALQEGDYSRAGAEVKDSLWCRQVGVRCKSTSTCVASGI
ncbi:hypothetical protein HDU97_004417 [Phlyctochytrium planicorne]|nr:hypothetical protein HDU97_004417 [Phlyctochytrium planicorne]